MSEAGWPVAPWRWVPASDPRIVAGIDAQMRAAHPPAGEPLEIVGWKIAANDPAARTRWGISDCLMGYLPSTTHYAEERRFDLSGFSCAAIEPELAILLGEDVAPDASAAIIESAIASISLAAELVDIRGRFDDLAAVLSHNIFHRAVVIGGGGQPYELGTTEGTVIQASRNGETLWTLPIGFLISDIRAVVSFVAKAVAARGHALEAGHLILSGLLTPIPIWARPDDKITVFSDGFDSVETSFF